MKIEATVSPLKNEHVTECLAWVLEHQDEIQFIGKGGHEVWEVIDLLQKDNERLEKGKCPEVMLLLNKIMTIVFEPFDCVDNKVDACHELFTRYEKIKKLLKNGNDDVLSDKIIVFYPTCAGKKIMKVLPLDEKEEIEQLQHFNGELSKTIEAMRDDALHLIKYKKENEQLSKRCDYLKRKRDDDVLFAMKRFKSLEEQLAEKDEKLSYYESDHLVSSITIDDKKYILLGDYRKMEKTKDDEIARLNKQLAIQIDATKRCIDTNSEGAVLIEELRKENKELREKLAAVRDELNKIVPNIITLRKGLKEESPPNGPPFQDVTNPSGLERSSPRGRGTGKAVPPRMPLVLTMSSFSTKSRTWSPVKLWMIKMDENIINDLKREIEMKDDIIEKLRKDLINFGKIENVYGVWRCRFCEYDCIVISQKMFEHGDKPRECVVHNDDTSGTGHELWDKDKTWKSFSDIGHMKRVGDALIGQREDGKGGKRGKITVLDSDPHEKSCDGCGGPITAEMKVYSRTETKFYCGFCAKKHGATEEENTMTSDCLLTNCVHYEDCDEDCAAFVKLAAVRDLLPRYRALRDGWTKLVDDWITPPRSRRNHEKWQKRENERFTRAFDAALERLLGEKEEPNDE